VKTKIVHSYIIIICARCCFYMISWVFRNYLCISRLYFPWAMKYEYNYKQWIFNCKLLFFPNLLSSLWTVMKIPKRRTQNEYYYFPQTWIFIARNIYYIGCCDYRVCDSIDQFEQTFLYVAKWPFEYFPSCRFPPSFIPQRSFRPTSPKVFRSFVFNHNSFVFLHLHRRLTRKVYQTYVKCIDLTSSPSSCNQAFRVKFISSFRMHVNWS